MTTNSPSKLNEGDHLVSAFHHGLLALLHRANQIATERFADALGEDDVTARQLQVLAAIESNEGLSQTAIVNSTGIDRSTLADIVRRLSKRKLIERRRSKDDARAYVVKLTAPGRRVLADGSPALGTVETGMLAALPAKQRTDFLAALEKVVASGEVPSTKSGRA